MENDSKKALEEILAAVRALEFRVTKLETERPPLPNVSNTEPSEKRLSIKEFIISQKPTNGVQMTLAIGYFLESYEKVSPFNAADIEAGFRTAREPVPSNINDKANMCVKNGYFMEDREKKDNKKSWVVTRTGEEAIRAGFGASRP